MRKFFTSFVLVLTLMASLACAGILYKPLPTSDALQAEAKDMIEGYAGRADYLIQKYSNTAGFQSCVHAAQPAFTDLQNKVHQLNIIYEYFDMYPDTAVSDHFEDKLKDIHKDADKDYTDLEACFVKGAQGQTEAQE